MRLLIIGRLGGHITAAGTIATARGATVSRADDLESGLRALRAGQGFELAMVDLDADVPALIAAMTRERMVLPVVACGVRNDPDAAVRAIAAGAREYVPLPPDPDLIAAVLTAVGEDSHDLIAKDPAMLRVLSLAGRVAASEASILINGESGTGKEVFARYIHRKSRRAGARFVSVNCAAIPDNLLESELFGHERGAFTGAVARRIGRFEEADGGTLLLDEISEMDPRLQAKLLRAVQEREIHRVGNNRPVRVNIRLIATTNRDLAAAVRSGQFREDLYYRLNVVDLKLPPLRARPADIPVLAAHFIDKFAALNEVPALKLADAALAALRRHPWRGNVRELENTMHRALLLAQGDAIGPGAIHLESPADQAGGQAGDPAADQAGWQPGTAAPGHRPADLAGPVASAAPASPVGRTVAEVERALILDTVSHCLGNRTHAATILGISIRTLRNKLKQYAGEGVAVPPAGLPAPPPAALPHQRP